jgi:CDP-diacylglycerol--serine O-phosphatidyltransferase
MTGNWTPLTYAALMIFIGMILDGLDGRIARLTRSTSELGEQLDSMADMVTFGVAPAFLAVQLIGVQTPFVGDAKFDGYFDRIAFVAAAIYVACAGLRLARFNIESKGGDASDHMSFSGLPSPGAAGTVAGIAWLHQHFLAGQPAEHWSVQFAGFAMLPLTLLVAVGMISRMKYPHVLNRYVRRRAKFEYVAWSVVIILLLVVHPQASVAGAFTIYALSAPATAVWRWFKPSQKPATVAAGPTMDEEQNASEETLRRDAAG